MFARIANNPGHNVDGTNETRSSGKQHKNDVINLLALFVVFFPSRMVYSFDFVEVFVLFWKIFFQVECCLFVV